MFSCSLRQKFIISVSLILAAWLATTAYIETRVSRRQLMESCEREAVRTAELVEWALREDMLTGRHPGIQDFFEEVGTQRELENVRIFGVEGRVRLSALDPDIGQVAGVGNG